MSSRVVFVSTDTHGAGRMAAALATRLLSPQVSVRTVALQSGTPEPCREYALREVGFAPEPAEACLIDRASFHQADVVVALDDDAAGELSRRGISFERWACEVSAESATGDLMAAARGLRDELTTALEELEQRLKPAPAIGIIGGSGFYDLPGVSALEEVAVSTPYGEPSDTFLVGTCEGRRVVFLPRHGRDHGLLPFEVNNRANFYGFKRLGVTHVISVSAVGSLREEIRPGDVVLPRQFIDRSTHRPVTFFGEGAVAHVSLADPICNRLADELTRVAHQETDRVHEQGTYLSMEGPQFSTRAESELYRSWGCDLIGMTNFPEARLAREAEICYATLALPTDYDCWRDGVEEVHVSDILAVLQSNVELARRILAGTLAAVDAAASCSCHRSLDMALVTPVDRLDTATRLRLHPVVQRRLQTPVTS